MGRKSLYYSVNNYSIDKPSYIPDDSTSIEAKITLYKSTGEQIGTWTATTFPYSLSQGGIENCAQGYITIDWTWTYKDEEGVEITETDTTKIENVDFAQE